MEFIKVESSVIPLLLLALISVLGYLIGKIKICKISLDISAVLIVAIVVGFLMSISPDVHIGENFNNSLDLYSKTGTALFVCAIGVSSGTSLARGSIKKNILYFLFGALMVIGAFVCAKCIEVFDTTFDRSLLLGTLCGALTSTPALSAICEDITVISENAVVGYGAAYLFGVVGVVVFVQYNVRFLKEEMRMSNVTINREMGYKSLTLMLFVILLGIFFGSIKLPFINRSLGLTGGILLLGIASGAILSKLKQKGKDFSCDISPYKNLGLIMFFVGNGIKAGMKLTSAVDVRCFVYGAIITAVAVMIGFVLGRIFCGKNAINRMFIVAGGMTSTPALGVLVSKSNYEDNMSTYSFAYLGALVTITFGINIV